MFLLDHKIYIGLKIPQNNIKQYVKKIINE